MKIYSISAIMVALLFLGMLTTLPHSYVSSSRNVDVSHEAPHVIMEESSLAPKTTLSGTYHGHGFYTYTNTFSLGAYTNLTFYAAAVPNRFTVKDANGNTVYATSWMGDASYYGPWGASLSTSNTAVYGLGAGSYTVYTDTVTNVNNGGADDYWSIYW